MKHFGHEHAGCLISGFYATYQHDTLCRLASLNLLSYMFRTSTPQAHLAQYHDLQAAEAWILYLRLR
jgi:hypothetical protein